MDKSIPLETKLEGFTGNKRRFLLFRIAGLDYKLALVSAGIKKSTHDGWTENKRFSEVNKSVAELSVEYKLDAIKLLRRENQVAMVLLERELIDKLREEIATDEPKFIKTALAREVYAKIMSVMDAVPIVAIQSWEEKVLTINSQAQEVLEGAYKEINGPDS